MAPAVAVDSHEEQWSEELENNVELEVASSSGNGSEGAPVEDQGWQTVNPRKQRRRERKEAAGGGLGQVELAESKGFEALEAQSEARRKAREPVPAGAGSEEAGESESEGSVNGDVKKKKKQRKAKVALDVAAQKIDPKDLESFLAQLTGEPVDQLQECVQYFSKKFSSSNTQFSWDKLSRECQMKSFQVPIQDIPETVIRVTSNWLASKSHNSCIEFIRRAVIEVLPDASTHSKSRKLATLVVLALLLRQKAEPLSTKLGSAADIASIPWICGQVALADRKSGLCMWATHLLPPSVENGSTPQRRATALTFFESFLATEDAKKNREVFLAMAAKRAVSPLSLIQLLRKAYPSESAKRNTATPRFEAIYPFVKEATIGVAVTRSNVMKQVAQELFPLAISAAGDDSPQASVEGCNLARWCLYQVPECYGEFKKKYSDRLKGSTRFLKFLVDEWHESASILSPLDSLKKTIADLRPKNASLVKKEDETISGYALKAEKYCKLLQRKMSFLPGCAKATLTLVVAVAGGVGLYMLKNINPWD